MRTHYTWDERLPGFFELDTVHHDGGSASGHYCATLTATDVFSGWTELRALRNRAHRWVKENVVEIRSVLPFPLNGVDSDDGGEFINTLLLNYCNDTGVEFTRGRPYRKNDNCFVEQKNDIAVRRTVGYYRFGTPLLSTTVVKGGLYRREPQGVTNDRSENLDSPGRIP